MLALLHQALIERISATIGDEEWQRLVAQVVDRESDPYTTADELARRIGLAPEVPEAEREGGKSGARM